MILDFRGFDSSGIFILRAGILMSIRDFPEVLSQQILADIILVGRFRSQPPEFQNHPPESQKPAPRVRRSQLESLGSQLPESQNPAPRVSEASPPGCRSRVGRTGVCEQNTPFTSAVAIFCSFSQFCEIGIFLLSL